MVNHRWVDVDGDEDVGSDSDDDGEDKRSPCKKCEQRDRREPGREVGGGNPISSFCCVWKC